MPPPQHRPPEIPPVYFKIHLKILFYLGIDIIPIQSEFRRHTFHVYTVLIIGLMLTFTTLEFLDMVLNFEGIYKMTFALCYFVTHILGTAKMFLMLALRRKLWHYLQTLENGVFEPNVERGGGREFELVQDAITLCRRQGCFFYTFVIFIIGARAVWAALANLPYDRSAKTMPYTTWLPFDYNDSPSYELVFAFQIFCTVVYGFYIGAADAVICGFMMLIKAQFLIIKATLGTLVERARRIAGASDKDSDEIVARFANACVYHHQELIALCDHAEDDFCYLMLLQFLSSLLIMCFQLFQLSTISPDSVEFFSMLLYLVLMMFQLLCYCWHGNEVQIVSGRVSSYAYDTDWIGTNDATKKTLLLMMMRAQRDCYFTAGKFSLLTLPTFMTIVRGAGSYFMVLRQMNS